MDVNAVLDEVNSWPVEERLRLLHEVWNRLLDQGYEPQLSEDLKAELDRRIASLEKNPDDVVARRIVEARVLKRLQK